MNEKRFDGDTYQHSRDFTRLTSQLERVKKLMGDGQFRTLSSIAMSCGGTEASISARLRDLRKPKFGKYIIRRRRIAGGLFEYSMAVPKLDAQPEPAPIPTAKKMVDDLFPVAPEQPT